MVAEVTDDSGAGAASGVLAFDLYGGGTLVQFKDIRLKRLNRSLK